jgi:hypothetical protein
MKLGDDVDLEQVLGFFKLPLLIWNGFCKS